MSTIPPLGQTPVPLGGNALRSPSKRTLVLCFDGTADSFDQDNSNVVQFLAMLKKDDPTEQLVYYQAGIGTYTGNNVLGTPIFQAASKLLDQMIAWNLPEHIKDGYRFLMQNYCTGDQICIFGFSRGAFTARALAGMIQKVGLLPRCNTEQLPFAYAMYVRNDSEGLDLSIQFKRTFSIEVKIRFLGVWDTVQSVGLIPKHLPFSGSNSAIVHFRHALSLDEHRVKFVPFFWTGEKPNQDATGTMASGHNDPARDRRRVERRRRERSGSSFVYETRVNSTAGQDTDVEEVFFAGAHCDVGGGSVKNGTRHSLARIPLRWMIRECYKVDSGINFDPEMLNHEVGLDIDSIYEAPKQPPPENLPLDSPRRSNEVQRLTLRRVPVAIFSRLCLPFRWLWGKVKNLHPQKPPQPDSFPKILDFEYEGEAVEDLNDALSPVYDQLDLHWYWRVMEWIPWIMKKQRAEIVDSDALWAYKLVLNRGKGRQVYHSVIRDGMKVHRSVQTRMLAQYMEGNGEPYLPKLRLVVDGELRRLTREEWLAKGSHYVKWVD